MSESVRSFRDREDDENRCPRIAHQPAFSDQALWLHPASGLSMIEASWLDPGVRYL